LLATRLEANRFVVVAFVAFKLVIMAFVPVALVHSRSVNAAVLAVPIADPFQ
jgi:hypothetical protein